MNFDERVRARQAQAISDDQNAKQSPRRASSILISPRRMLAPRAFRKRRAYAAIHRFCRCAFIFRKPTRLMRLLHTIERDMPAPISGARAFRHTALISRLSPAPRREGDTNTAADAHGRAGVARCATAGDRRRLHDHAHAILAGEQFALMSAREEQHLSPADDYLRHACHGDIASAIRISPIRLLEVEVAERSNARRRCATILDCRAESRMRRIFGQHYHDTAAYLFSYRRPGLKCRYGASGARGRALGPTKSDYYKAIPHFSHDAPLSLRAGRSGMLIFALTEPFPIYAQDNMSFTSRAVYDDYYSPVPAHFSAPASHGKAPPDGLSSTTHQSYQSNDRGLRDAPHAHATPMPDTGLAYAVTLLLATPRKRFDHCCVTDYCAASFTPRGVIVYGRKMMIDATLCLYDY